MSTASLIAAAPGAAMAPTAPMFTIGPNQEPKLLTWASALFSPRRSWPVWAVMFTARSPINGVAQTPSTSKRYSTASAAIIPRCYRLIPPGRHAWAILERLVGDLRMRNN